MSNNSLCNSKYIADPKTVLYRTISTREYVIVKNLFFIKEQYILRDSEMEHSLDTAGTHFSQYVKRLRKQKQPLTLKQKEMLMQSFDRLLTFQKGLLDHMHRHDRDILS